MARNKEELCLSSRYIHTGNSGVTFSITRDVRRVDRAVVFVQNGAFGAFSTNMEIRGNDYKGLTARQLRDLALMFLDAAAYLEQGELPLTRDTPALVPDSTHNFRRAQPPSIQDLLSDDSDLSPLRQAVSELLTEFPDMRHAYVLFARRSSNSNEASTDSSASKSKTTTKRIHEELRDERLMDAGLDLIRAWWSNRLTRSALYDAEARFDEALYARSSESNPTTNEELEKDPHSFK